MPSRDKVIALLKELRSIESRVFCSTGKGGGKDSSCSPKDAGGGGGVQELSEPVAIGRNGTFPFAPKKNDLGKPPKFSREDARSDVGDSDFAGKVAKDAGLPPHTEPGEKPGYSRGTTAWHSIAMPAVAVSKLEKSGYKKVAVAKDKDGKTVTYLEKNRGKSGRDPTGTEASATRKPGDRHSVVVVSSGIYGNEKGSQITTYASDMTYDSLSAGRRRGPRRSAQPVVESRSLAVERRSFAVECADSGEPSLRVESRCECQGDGEETKREYIVGYAAKFGVNSLDLGKFTERIAPSAFNLVTERRGRKKPLETRALFNHNADMPLAKHPGTLKLSVDDVGLRYEFPVPDTSYGRDLASNIRNGIVTGSSFSFTVPKDGEEWSMEEGRSIRTVKRVDSLIDVGPVTYPAYPDTDTRVAQRSYDDFMARMSAVEPRVSCSLADSRSRKISCIARRAAADLKLFLAKHGC
jgi:HK97 family phage prohead protease